MSFYKKTTFLEIIETPAPPRGTKIKHGAKEQQNEWSENWICFILAARIIGLQHRDGKWNYLLSRKQIENVLPLPAWYCWINSWIVTFGNIKTLNNFLLELEYPYKQQNNIISPLGLNFITNEYTNSLLNCTCYSPLETQSTSFDSAFLDILDESPNSNHSLQKCFKHATLFQICYR